MTAEIITAQDGHVFTITMNRPQKKNALTKAMYTAIGDALEYAAGESSVRVVILRGTGGSFTAGNDLADFAAGDLGGDGEEVPVFRVLRLASTFEKPLMAAIEGPAVGIGTTILLHCDFAVAEENAKFAMPFVNLGVCPEAASSYLLPKIMGHMRAAELLLFGDPFSAATAREYGLLNRVVDSAEEVYTEAEKVAHHLATKPPAAVRLAKQLMKEGEAKTVADTMVREGAHFVQRLSSPEAQEAFMAFAQRRKPDFSSFD